MKCLGQFVRRICRTFSIQQKSSVRLTTYDNLLYKVKILSIDIFNHKIINFNTKRRKNWEIVITPISRLFLTLIPQVSVEMR
jgi:hypothetical protein